MVVVVVETDKLHEMSHAAIEHLGEKLKSKRAVHAEARRFADEIASNLTALQVETLDVIGFCNYDKERPGVFEPLVIDQGQPRPVTLVFAGLGVEYWVAASVELAKSRSAIVASCAQKLAESTIISEAMMTASHEADRDPVFLRG